RVETTVATASHTLIWFAQHFVKTNSVPSSTSRLLERTLPGAHGSLRPAFDLWHAMLRAERVLRLCDDSRATDLRKAIGQVQATLALSIAPRLGAGPGSSIEPLVSYAHCLVSDPVYGTLSIPAAAAVLRSEIYPVRSESSPSYLAGLVLYAGLRMAEAHADSHA